MDELISRRAAIDATWEEPTYNDPLNVLTEVRDRLKALPSAQPEPRWIPAEIKPPKECKSYWVCTDTGYQCQCRWTNNRFGMFESEWGWSIFDIPQYTKVVAYMPLPKPYERSEDE